MIDRLWPASAWLTFLLFSTVLVLDKAYNLFALSLLALAGMVLCARRPHVDTTVRWLIIVLSANVLLAVLNVALARDGVSGIEKPLKLLLLVPLLLAVSQSGLRTGFLYSGMAIGALAAAIGVTYQYHWLNMYRPGIHYNPLPFSEVAMSMFAVLLGATIAVRGRQKYLYVSGMLAALYCVLMSSSRGSLLAVVPMGGVLLLWLWWRSQLRVLMRPWWVLAATLIVVAITALAWNNSIVVRRVVLAHAEFHDYFENRVTQNNVGARLEMWRGALLAATERPLIGVGVESRNDFIRGRVEAGELMPIVLKLRHAHSEYFEGLQINGLLGLLVTMGLFFVPLWLFLRHLKVARGAPQGIALGGAMVVVGYATYALTEVPLHNSLTVVFYTMYLAVALGALEYARRETDANTPRQSRQ